MKKKLSIIGGGAAGLFVASFLDTHKFDVTIYEQKASLGRKFLVAGDGGFNLTHSEDMANFKQRYSPEAYLDHVFDVFSNEDMRKWLLSIGIPTFVGSSGKVFPEKGIKPINVLKSIEQHIVKRGVSIAYKKRFTGWSENQSIVLNDSEMLDSERVVFALGGSSWKVTGSDGHWLDIFTNNGIKTIPFRSSNCAFKIPWTQAFLSQHEGTPLKNITASIDHKTQKGEAVITQFGLEGNAIYGLSPLIQHKLETDREATILIDFKPTLSLENIIEKLQQSTSNTTSTLKQNLRLALPALTLIKSSLNKSEFLDNATLAQSIKKYPIKVTGAANIDEAISTGGGVCLSAIDRLFQLNTLKGQYCIGEMLDWDAPTGGYLLQACASMGVYVAKHLNNET